MNPAIDYKKLSHLGELMKQGVATQQQKDEFMLMLYQNGNISKKQYDDYLAGKNAEAILKTALAIGVIVLLTFMFAEFANKS